MTSNAQPWQPTSEVIEEWAATRLAAARAAGTSPDYFPRLPGRPRDEAARLAVSIIRLPLTPSIKVRRQATEALGELASHPQMRWLNPQEFHVTNGGMPFGADPAEDAALIEEARQAHADAFARAVQGAPPFDMTLNGLTVLPKQLLATYDVRSWRQNGEVTARLREAIPELGATQYPLDKSPLEGGQILQTTLAVFEAGVDLAAVADAIEPYLPGADSKFRPVTFRARTVEFGVHEHSPEHVLRTTSVLTHGRLTGRAIANDFGAQQL